MWGLVWELAPCHWGMTGEEGLPSGAWGFVLASPCAGWAAETMGAAASGAGIAGWQGSVTFLYLRPRERNLIRGEQGRSPGWGRPFGLRAAVCVHGNLRASTGGFPII